jgi:hypothetical protein
MGNKDGVIQYMTRREILGDTLFFRREESAGHGSIKPGASIPSAEAGMQRGFKNYRVPSN